MPRLINRQIIFAVLQPNVNAPVAVAGSDAILASNLDFSYIDEKLVEREALRTGSLGPLAPCFVTRRAQLTFSTEVRGGGGADTPPEIATLLQIAGYSQAITPATSVSYSLLADPSSQTSWATIDFYYDREFVRLQNCVASHRTVMNANQSVMDEWTVVGQIVSINTNAAQAVPAYQTTKPIQANNITFNYPLAGAGTNQLSSFTFDLANELLNEESLQSPDGFIPAEVTSRGPVTGTINPIMEIGAPNIDWNALLAANTVQALGVGAIGTVGGNICTFTFPAVSVTSVQHGERNKLLNWEIALRFSETSSLNDEISRVYS